ncbi:LacI family DNA-binding transcriptional regulator [Neorhizobium sp. CSC1952]|uniref:LacI family DNA-binding transcriptional regulator n=1 Tax=Neorhizobium sp. CSC1952 TaxID=2978974 RepID=UPI0025A5DE3A|nr:LacI family DNA-binding transcriptional regulator [Rhizobium sp. CSC1952]WJR67801.1 LacI family DNA-binding transcriptional regulator [Rhizobium sp. CSC1952]
MSHRNSKSERVTLLDVANALGISAITVSRALRDPGKVSEALREKILSQVEEMGYMPDLAARALASRLNGTICVLVPALTHQGTLNFVRGIEARTQGTDFRIQYANCRNDPEEERRLIRLFLSQYPAGIIFAGLDVPEKTADLLKSGTCPVVHVIDPALRTKGAAVGGDNFEAAAAATRHLLACGYRRIGLLGAHADIRGQRRQQGYRAAMQEAGLYDPALVVCDHTPATVELGCRLLRRLVDGVKGVDAVFCQDDDIALGALFESRRLGLRVPEDLGICGYGDLPYSAHTEPPLTTVRVPAFDIGYRAADLLVRARAGVDGADGVVNLSFELIRRGSTRSSCGLRRETADETLTAGM